MHARRDTQTSTRTMALGLALLVILGATWAHAAGGQIAVVTGIVRGLEIKPAGGASWNRATVWMPIRSGDALRTGEGQQASVMLADTSQMKLDANTEIVVHGYTLEARRGHVWLLVQGNRKPYQVTTPNAVAGIEGTELEVEVSEAAGSNTTVRVVQGSVMLASSTGASGRVEAMSERSIQGQAAPSPSRRLEPRVLAWVEGARRYTEIKARVERNITTILEEATAASQERHSGSVGQRLAHLRGVLNRLNVEVAAFADLEPPPLFVHAHAHRLLALDTLALAMRELEAGILTQDLLKARSRAGVLLRRAHAENAIATRQYQGFTRVYDQIVARLERPASK